MTAPVPIEAQIAEVERELGMRARVYPGFVARGKMDQVTADVHMARMAAALASLRMIEKHKDGLRELIKYLRSADLQPGEMPSAEEAQALMAHPAVQELVRHFPEAELVASHPVTLPAPEAGDPDQATLEL